VLVGVLALAVKVAVLGLALAVGEVFLAKLRLFRVPELLAARSCWRCSRSPPRFSWLTRSLPRS